MSRYYSVEVDGKTVYACTDWNRFVREVAKQYARVRNAVLVLPTKENRANVTAGSN